MGLLDKLGLAARGRAKSAPAPVAANGDPQAVCAPVSGRPVALADVSDPVFAQGMLGPGLGIQPTGDVAYAPVTGVVTADVKTRHALVFKAEGGAEVLLHVGLDSVALRGEGFRQLVERGAEVRAGDPVLCFDCALMAELGLDATVVVTVTNSDDFARVEILSAAEKDGAADGSAARVRAGAAVLRCVP